MCSERYRQAFDRACQQITQSDRSPQEQLLAVAELYRDGLGEGQICLCAMLSADFAVLPATVQAEIRLFFQHTEQWLVTLLQQDRSSWGSSDTQVQSEAKGLIALFSGAQLLARTSPEPDQAFDRCVQLGFDHTGKRRF